MDIDILNIDIAVKSIFTENNKKFILRVLESLRDEDNGRIKDSEFETVVFNARIQGQNDMINKVSEFIDKIK